MAIYRSRSLRLHLLQLVLVSLIPAVVFSAAVMLLLARAQDAGRSASQVHAVRALAQTIDAKLDAAIARADHLSRIPAAGFSLVELEGISALVLAGSPELSNVLLIDPEGYQTFNVAARGRWLPRVGSRPEQIEARDQQKTVVTDVFVGATRRLPVIDIVTPVKGERFREYLLVVSLDLTYFDQFVKAALGREGGIASLLDRQFRFIARSTATEERRGQAPGAGLLAAISQRPEGVERLTTVEGLPVYSAWTRTRLGWTVNYGAPADAIEAPLRQAMLLLGGSWVFVFLIALGLALHKQRQIGRHLALVADKARNLRTARALPLPQSHITELDDALTALRDAREALEEALRRERETRREAEQVNRAKDEFLAMLGHELRNPLAAITNATRILQSASRTAAHEASATAIVARQTEHLTGIVNDLLDVGRAMTGKIVLQRGPVELATIARHIVATFEVAGRLARHRVGLRADTAWVEGDRTRLEQVLVNLLNNALTYSPPDAAIDVRVACEEDAAVIEVSDEGAGIAPHDLPRVFDLFFQSQQTVDRPQGGLGIGLTLVKRLVELHGGTVTACSRGLGQGARFTVRLPRAAPPPGPAAGEGGGRGAQRHILVVEDNPDTRLALRLALELEGHRVVEAADGGQALAAVASFVPDVALIDIGLPGMDGHALAAALRARGLIATVLVALTGYGAERDRERARAAGFDAHLTKPADFDALLELVAATGARGASAPAAQRPLG